MLPKYLRPAADLVYQPIKRCTSSPPETRSQTDELYDFIFAIDERTGLPSGSLAQFMSDKTSEEVKRFINDTILHGGEQMANLADAEFSGLPGNVQEQFKQFKGDFLAEMNRGRRETMQDYEARIGKFLQDEKTVASWRQRFAAEKKNEKS